ncbi:MAG TPA: transcriptional repressor [Chitinophagales bacterium]|jgi:Fur family ferric uptake transcriptional regulator|nr:transcriptional repressor [Chitinophagales bacterium]
MQNLEHILKHHNLRITQVRLEILQFFQTNKIALTHADLETFFSKKFDRVTIYRTLTSFLENGLLHKIPDDSGIAKYALCHHEGTEHTHDDHHVHFKCKKCEKIECLHNLEIPKLHLPKKYKMEHANLLIEGICAYCNP